MEKYAEYLLWEYIKKNKLEHEFIRNYKDGHRRFDFYNKKENLIVEIRSQKKLEKLESFYKEYIKTTNKKLILIPIADIIENIEAVIDETIEALEHKEKGVIFNHHEVRDLKPLFVSHGVKDRQLFSTPLHVDINLVDNDILNIDEFKKWRSEYNDVKFILEDGKYICGWEVEKMSKSKHNVQNPDYLIDEYGADTLRLYEMFLGPLETHKPWDTKGIEGVFRFIKKLWRLYHNESNNFDVSDAKASKEELKVLHKTIKKIKDDIERFSFNTAVSTFMICVNELSDLKCNKREILEPLAILVSSYAPHIAEELWSLLGNEKSITKAKYPEFNKDFVAENTFTYPVSFNGKMRFKLELPVDMPKDEIEKAALEAKEAQKWIEGKTPRKIIVVPKRIINIVV
ncbi:MAG: class I tRNA ligase family protein [Bacteroidales bacterium]|nr:class I tRNA ligase family protein [Bacteroidales bacterium]